MWSVNRRAKFIQDSKTCTTGWGTGEKQWEQLLNVVQSCLHYWSVTSRCSLFLFLKCKGTYFRASNFLPVQLQTSEGAGNTSPPKTASKQQSASGGISLPCSCDIIPPLFPCLEGLYNHAFKAMENHVSWERRALRGVLPDFSSCPFSHQNSEGRLVLGCARGWHWPRHLAQPMPVP